MKRTDLKRISESERVVELIKNAVETFGDNIDTIATSAATGTRNTYGRVFRRRVVGTEVFVDQELADSVRVNLYTIIGAVATKSFQEGQKFAEDNK